MVQSATASGRSLDVRTLVNVLRQVVVAAEERQTSI